MSDIEAGVDIGVVPEAKEGSYEAYVNWIRQFREQLHPSLAAIEIVDDVENQTNKGSPIEIWGGKAVVGGYRQPGVYVFSPELRRMGDGGRYARNFILTQPDGVLDRGSLTVAYHKDHGTLGSYSTSPDSRFNLEEQKSILEERDGLLKRMHELNQVRKQVDPFRPPSFE
jgi:hypothetical protein